MSLLNTLEFKFFLYSSIVGVLDLEFILQTILSNTLSGLDSKTLLSSSLTLILRKVFFFISLSLLL